ncbi:hypothetical protein [Cohnella sp.]|uniref:hypothetical protein n=1 Tax=Cohnella sp. TaxID=1883426 RepID=UPI003569731A
MTLMKRGVDIVHFHRDMTNAKTCPGSGVDKAEFVAAVKAYKTENVKSPDGLLLNVKDAEKIIALLGAAYNLTGDKEARAEVHRLANEVRRAAGIPVGK